MAKKHKGPAYLEGVLSVILNFVLFGLKYWAGLATGSLALMADAWHTLSDSLTSVVVIVATKLSSKPADQEHPFGHGRFELIGSIVIGMLLALVAFNFATEAIGRFTAHDEVVFGTLAIIVTIVSIVVKEGLAQFAFHVARKTGSRAVKADGWHHRSDALSSLVILVGILLGRYFWWVDSLLGFVVALMIFYATFEILKKNINALLGEVPGDELETRVKQLAGKTGFKAEQLHHLHAHHYGDHTELTFHVYMAGDITLEEAHRKVNSLEEEIRSQLGIEATIHMEPLEK